MLSRSCCTLLLVLALIGSPDDVRAREPEEAASIEFFEKNVRPVLVEKCLSCHGAAKAKGGLRLDSREALIRGGNGGAVVVAGKPKESRLITAIYFHDPDLRMPPRGKLPDRTIAALEKWVELGVPWSKNATLAAAGEIATAAEKHWAFQPVRRPAVPAGLDAIDHFLLERLRKEGLTYSPPLDRRGLIRRATFDLHGLPPTPEEVEAFVNDPDPEAYPKLLDRLLASPRYGERWGRHWLDVARYADNKGYVFFEGKEYTWAWTYRDYVIAAFNADKPYDRFVMEQLAADQLCPDDVPAQAALGFLTVGGHFMNNTHDIIDDRIDVVTRGLMGLTVTCARCHDHKFDPVPSADYYSLYGVFRSSTELAVPPLAGPPPSTGEYLLYDAELGIRARKLQDFVVARHQGLVNGARKRVAEYLLAAHAARNQPPADDFMLIADPGDLNPSMITRWRQYLTDTRKRRHPVWVYWNAVSELPEDGFAARAAAALEGVKGNRLVAEAFATPPALMKDVAARYARVLEQVDRLWQEANARGDNHLADPAAEELRRVLYGSDSPADALLALDWGFLSLFPDRATQGEYQNLLRSLENWLVKGPPRSMVMHDLPRPYDPRVFERGNPGRPGEPVPRQIPAIVDHARRPFGEGSGRLELARAVVAKSNPLTARVFVNRVWMHHFGRGLVGTPGDFGLRGDAPTHPELLDWLAAEWVAPSSNQHRPWSVKRLHKMIMTSAAYMQSSRASSSYRLLGLTIRSSGRDPGQVDPENRLLWRQNPRRLEYEALHDSLLAVSGQLDLNVGGPSIRPGAGYRRRAVYAYVDRLEFPSLLTTFDVPNPAACIPERTSTTVAPQALYLMNGPLARNAAKQLIALSAIRTLTDPSRRLERIYLTVYGRLPTDAERQLALAFVAKRPDRWVDLAHGLLLTNEFAFID